MPKIKVLDEQNDALRDVSEMLRDVEGINKFLEVPNESGEFIVSFTSPDGKTIKAKLRAEKEHMDKMFLKNKKAMANTAKKLCSTLHIEMDPEEKAALGIEERSGEM